MQPFKRGISDGPKKGGPAAALDFEMNLTPQEKKLYNMYGNGKRLLHKGLLHTQGRKYFDSGDYALSKAGRAPQSNVGTAIPNPENIPHASSLGNGHSNGHQIISISPTNSTSPMNRESSLANDMDTQVPVDGVSEGGVPKDEQLPKLPESGGKIVDEAKLPGSEGKTVDNLPGSEELPGSEGKTVDKAKLPESGGKTVDEAKLPGSEELPGSEGKIVDKPNEAKTT